MVKRIKQPSIFHSSWTTVSHVTLINHELLLKKGGKGEVTLFFGRSCVKANKWKFKGNCVIGKVLYPSYNTNVVIFQGKTTNKTDSNNLRIRRVYVCSFLHVLSLA